VSSGKVHLVASLTITGLAVAGYIVYPVVGLETAALIGAGMVAGALITPDLDVDNRTHEETIMYRVPIIGPLLGILWQTYWMPYALAIPHRSWLSHGPFIGTALRMVYTLAIPIVLGWLVPSWAWILPVFAGWATVDLVHIVLDALTTTK